MTRKNYGDTALVLEKKGLIEGFQYSNRLLMDANQELKKAIGIESEFIAKMSHEFCASLNVIIGFTELLLDEVPGQINEEQRNCLNDILTSSKRMLNLVNTIRDQSEVKSGIAQYSCCEH
jgi:signal transduction histidine kinase